jgi:hypothetical protein
MTNITALEGEVSVSKSELHSVSRYRQENQPTVLNIIPTCDYSDHYFHSMGEELMELNRIIKLVYIYS